MLAWKEKVADRLARLLADSPPSPSLAPAVPVQPPQMRSALPPALLALALRRCHLYLPFFFLCGCGSWRVGVGISTRVPVVAGAPPGRDVIITCSFSGNTVPGGTSSKKAWLSSYVLSLLPTSNSGDERNSPCSELRPLPPESFPKRWRGNNFSWKDPPLELSEESGSESDRDERNRTFSNNQVPHSYRSVDNSNGNEETSTSDCAGTLHYLTEKSIFVSPKLFAFFQSSLPGTLKGCHSVLLYSTWKHGISLRTLLCRSENVQGPCLLIVGDMQGAVFGGLLNSPLRPTDKRKYQGTNQTFVFTTINGEPRLFRPTGANRYYYLCLKDALAFGGGGNFALCVDEDLLCGSSGSCETFGNSCLAHTPEFELKNVVLWGFTHSWSR